MKRLLPVMYIFLLLPFSLFSAEKRPFHLTDGDDQESKKIHLDHQSYNEQRLLIPLSESEKELYQQKVTIFKRNMLHTSFKSYAPETKDYGPIGGYGPLNLYNDFKELIDILDDTLKKTAYTILDTYLSVYKRNLTTEQLRNLLSLFSKEDREHWVFSNFIHINISLNEITFIINILPKKERSTIAYKILLFFIKTNHFFDNENIIKIYTWLLKNHYLSNGQKIDINSILLSHCILTKNSNHIENAPLFQILEVFPEEQQGQYAKQIIDHCLQHFFNDPASTFKYDHIQVINSTFTILEHNKTNQIEVTDYAKKILMEYAKTKDLNHIKTSFFDTLVDTIINYENLPLFYSELIHYYLDDMQALSRLLTSKKTERLAQKIIRSLSQEQLQQIVRNYISNIQSSSPCDKNSIKILYALFSIDKETDELISNALFDSHVTQAIKTISQEEYTHYFEHTIDLPKQIQFFKESLSEHLLDLREWQVPYFLTKINEYAKTDSETTEWISQFHKNLSSEEKERIDTTKQNQEEPCSICRMIPESKDIYINCSLFQHTEEQSPCNHQAQMHTNCLLSWIEQSPLLVNEDNERISTCPICRAPLICSFEDTIALLKEENPTSHETEELESSSSSDENFETDDDENESNTETTISEGEAMEPESEEEM